MQCKILCKFAPENALPGMKHACNLIILVLCIFTSSLLKAEPLHLLGIGNSFTEDMLQLLPFLLPDSGSGELDVAYLYRPGATLDQYCQMMKKDERECSFFEFDPVSGNWNMTDHVLIDSVLALKRWDVITLQQASPVSGFYNTIKPNLEVVLDTIEYYQPTAQIAWHATWSYSKTYNNSNYQNYDYSQLKMDYAIEHTTLELMDDFANRIDIIIPSQQLIKQLRLTALNDSLDLTRDGIHLSPFAAEAVSDLVYEILFAPRLGISIIENEHEAIKDTIHSASDFKIIKQMAFEVCHDSLIWEHLSENIVYKTEYYTLKGLKLKQPVYRTPIIRRNHYLSGDIKGERIVLLEE